MHFMQTFKKYKSAVSPAVVFVSTAEELQSWGWFHADMATHSHPEGLSGASWV